MKNSTADFESIMALAAIDSLSVGGARSNVRKYRKYVARPRAGRRDRVANLGIFLAISVFTSVVFVAGLLPGSVEAPQMWTHAFIALTIAQFVMLAAATLKASSPRDREAVVLEQKLSVQSRLNSDLDSGAPADNADLPIPPVAISSGLMGGKAYVSFSDGSVEIDTMLGRRRFVDLNAAREFVGG